MNSTRFLVLLEEVHIRLLNYKIPLNFTPCRFFSTLCYYCYLNGNCCKTSGDDVFLLVAQCILSV
jgi:hypothetical protein